MLNKFWSWYEKNIFINQTVVAVLFLWQVFHLYWLTTNVVAERIIGFALFSPSNFYETLLIIADYFEIPALIGGTVFYMYSWGQERSKKNLFFILLINSQWLHLFWITDEFVVEQFRGENPIMPAWLAWFAIFIDYLELPVILDTIKKTVRSKILNLG